MAMPFTVYLFILPKSQLYVSKFKVDMDKYKQNVSVWYIDI